jgi:hypothetical protein
MQEVKRCSFKTSTILRIVKPWRKLLCFPFFPLGPTAEDIQYTSIVPDTSPGILYKILAKESKLSSLLYGQKKGAFAASILATSMWLFKGIVDGSIQEWKVPVEIGGREKVTTFSMRDQMVGKDMHTRIVSVMDATLVVFVSTLCQFFIREAGANFKKNSCLWIGQSMTHLGWGRLYSFEECEVLVECDGNKYDQNLPPQVVSAAIYIFRDVFPGSQDFENIFKFLQRLHSDWCFIDPNGHVYRVKGGMNSGGGDTTLLNSICNFIIWIMTLVTCPYFFGVDIDECVFSFMGDDVKMGFKGNSAKIVKNVDHVKLNAWMKSNLNYSFGDDWKVSHFNPDQDVDAIHFLGVSIVRHTISFDIVRWVKKFLCAQSEVARKSKNMETERFASVMYGVGMSDLRAYKWDIGGMAIPEGNERDIAASLIAMNDVILDSEKRFNELPERMIRFASFLNDDLEQKDFRKKCLDLLGVSEKIFLEKFNLVRAKMANQYSSIYDSYCDDPKRIGAHWDHKVKKNFNELFAEKGACLPDIYSKRLIKYIYNRKYKQSSEERS